MILDLSLDKTVNSKHLLLERFKILYFKIIFLWKLVLFHLRYVADWQKTNQVQSQIQWGKSGLDFPTEFLTKAELLLGNVVNGFICARIIVILQGKINIVRLSKNK